MLLRAVFALGLAFILRFVMFVMARDAGSHQEYSGQRYHGQQNDRREIVLNAEMVDADGFAQLAEQIRIGPLQQNAGNGRSQRQTGLPHQEE